MKQLKEIIKHILFGIFKYVLFLGDRITLKVKAGPAKGVKLRIDIRDNYQYFIGNYDSWFLKDLDFGKYIKEGDVAWDCGSYIGYYTAIFRNYVGNSGKVYTFEASPSSYNVVNQLPKINNWDNVYCHNLAIGAEDSVLNFTNNIGGSNGPADYSKKFSEDVDLEIVKVKCYGTDELIEKLNIALPDFIKFDLESAEEFALMNGDHVFMKKRPTILMESHTKVTLQTVVDFGEKYNYSLYNLNQHGANKLIKYDPEQDMERKEFWVMFLCVPN